MFLGRSAQSFSLLPWNGGKEAIWGAISQLS